ncbi:hypothetical protein [Microbispora triticiradicis]|uniref:hypothetical protein n=1 Tax=Microbispora triticiradicis TaxID=2200763 RepID=UPI001AD73EFB|nr:hypothetical protein [Microbispora triticiradicis]MBO4275543.1 hypothetical protein [Microbispora triticiradicis]
MRKVRADALVVAALAASTALPIALPITPFTPSLALAAGPGARQAERDGVGGAELVAVRVDPLTITVPGSASLGTGTRGGTISASMGTVTVADQRSGIPPWTATVSATNFTTGSGTPAQTITTANVTYWSGPVTASSGAGTRFPGQPTAADRVPLTSPVVAFSGRKQVTPMSTSWQPTLVIAIPSGAAGGVYTGTITHSVA